MLHGLAPAVFMDARNKCEHDTYGGSWDLILAQSSPHKPPTRIGGNAGTGGRLARIPILS
jgi:hypothetical protein